VIVLTFKCSTIGTTRTGNGPGGGNAEKDKPFLETPPSSIPFRIEVGRPDDRSKGIKDSPFSPRFRVFWTQFLRIFSCQSFLLEYSRRSSFELTTSMDFQ
jgi:hypothetical protein